MACFYVAPLALICAASLATPDIIGRPVYGWYTENFALVFQSTYLPVVLRTFAYAAIATVLSLLVGYPCAYAISRYGGRFKAALLLAVLVPWLADYLVRIYAWLQVLGHEGPVNSVLIRAGIGPVTLIGNPYALNLGLVYSFLPFMVLPIYVAIERIDPRIVEAARDLYANPALVFRTVILPLSLPGVFAGVLMTFVPVSCDYVNSSVLGGTSTTMIGQVIQAQYLTNSNYPTASALSFVLMAVLLIGVFAYARALGTEDVMKVAAR